MELTPDAPLQTRVVDDKSPIIIPWILSRIAEYKKQHLEETNPRPFIVGLNGVQGVGKTTLVRALAQTLQEREGLPTLVVSIDDFYLTHADQLALAAAHPDNALVQHRGEPGTHDIPLLTTFLDALQSNSHPVPIPQYDKSAFSGLGWCVGFRPLDPADLSARWSAGSSRTLHKHKLEHLQLVNERLADYDRVVNGALDAFVHIDAEDTEYVYAWRAEQEAQLRREKGSGMTEEQVVRFVDAYYPAYELYTDGVRRGVFEGVPGRQGCQLRVVVGRDRAVVESMVI